MERIRDESRFDTTVVGFLISDRLRIRRPPETLVAIHFFLRHKLGRPVLKRFGCAGSQGRVRLCFQIDDMQFAGLHRSDGVSIRRETRIDPIATR